MSGKAIPCILLMLFGAVPLSVSNTAHFEKTVTVSSFGEDEGTEFNSAFLFVMRHEDPRLTGMITVDRGGRTRFGVSEKAHPEAWKSGPPSFDTALELARIQFWDRHRLAGVNSQEIANYILDMIYNEGPAAIKLVQVAVNDFEFAVVDGQLGAQTLAAINRQKPAAFLQSLSNHRKLFYTHLAQEKRRNARWLPIWLQRAADGVVPTENSIATRNQFGIIAETSHPVSSQSSLRSRWVSSSPKDDGWNRRAVLAPDGDGRWHSKAIQDCVGEMSLQAACRWYRW